MKRNHKLFAIIFAITLIATFGGLPVLGQSQNLAPFEKQFVSLWEETYAQLMHARWGAVSPQEVNALQLKGVPFFLLDVRTPIEFQTQRIAGAVNIPLDQLPLRLHELPGDREMIVVVYCKAGQQGGLGFSLVRQFGYVNAKNLVGGLNAWKAEGLVVDKTPIKTAQLGPQRTIIEREDAWSKYQEQVGTIPIDPQPTALAPFEKQFISLWDEMLTQVKTTGWGGISRFKTYAMLVANTPFLALDVRTPAEYASGHIEGAINIPLNQLPARLGELPADPEAIIVVYCQGGQRGALGYSLVRQLGFVNAKNLVGGFDAWKAEGYPVAP